MKSLSVRDDVQAAKEWLPRLLKQSACPFTPRGVFFNILDVYGEMDDYGGYGPNYADVCPVFFADYDVDDVSMQWIYSNERHDIDDSNACLPALREAGLIFNGSTDAIGSEVYIAHSVGYVLLLLRDLLNGELFTLLKAESPVGIAAGFGSGDLMSLGELTNDGFIVSSKPFLRTSTDEA